MKFRCCHCCREAESGPVGENYRPGDYVVCPLCGAKQWEIRPDRIAEVTEYENGKPADEPAEPLTFEDVQRLTKKGIESVVPPEVIERMRARNAAFEECLNDKEAWMTKGEPQDLEIDSIPCYLDRSPETRTLPMSGSTVQTPEGM